MDNGEGIAVSADWLDTANGYTCSESYIGEAIKPYARGRLKLFSKSSSQDDPETFRAHVLLSLERLQTDYLDLLS